VHKCKYEEKHVTKADFFFRKMDKIRSPKRLGSFIGSEGLRALNELRAKNVLCDAVLRTEDGAVFPVHSTLLLIHSNFFRFVWLLMWFSNV
jgi:hypothetical protein